MRAHRDWSSYPLAFVFVAAVLVRVAAQILLGSFLHPTTWEYEDIANSLLAGRGYTYISGGTTYVAAVSSPLYVLLTTAIYFVTGHSQAVMLVAQALIGGATASLAAWLAQRMYSVEAAWAAGGLVAIDPALAVYTGELHPLTLDAFAFLATVALVIAIPRRPTWRRMAIVGLVVGVAALTRTTVLASLPLLLWWLSRYRGLRLTSWGAAALVVVALAVYAPWPVRNSVLLGEPVLGSSESTEWWWRGTNPRATGSSLTRDGRTMLQVAPPEVAQRIAGASEVERMNIYRDMTIQFIAASPGQALGLYLTKFASFWIGSSATGLLYPAVWVRLYTAWFVAIGALAVWGIVKADDRSAVNLIVASMLLVALTQAIFYVEGRHRLAVEPLLLVLSGGGLAALSRTAPRLRHWRERHRLRSADRAVP